MESKQFNGFVNIPYKKCKDKVPVEKGTYQLENIDFNDTTWDWGLVIPEDIVVVDSDTMEESEVIFNIIKDFNVNCYISKSSRGYHFYFRIPKDMRIANGVDKTIPIGLVDIDYKSGQKDCYVIENKKGVWNQWIKAPKYVERVGGFALDSFDIDELPFWLYPLKTAGLSLLGLEESDGRNNELFRLKTRLANFGFNEEMVLKTFTMINNYVFKDKLSERELNTVAKFSEDLKISVENRWFDDKNRFKHDEMARYMSKVLYAYKNHVGTIYYFNGKYYTQDPKVLEQKIVEECPILRSTQRQEVIKFLELIDLKSTIEPIERHDYICVNNGLVNGLTGKKIGFTPAYFITNQFDVDFNANAKDEHVDYFLDSVLVEKGDKEQRMIFEEYLGYTLIAKDNFMKKMLLMIGSHANNGKSTTEFMVQELLRHENYSSLAINQLNDKNDKILVELVGKCANFDDEGTDGTIKGDTMRYLKTLISDENKVTINPKFKTPYKDFIRAKFWVASNHILKTQQKGNEWMTRLLILSFNNVFDGSKRDPMIKNMLKTPNAKSYLLNLAIQGYQRIRKNGYFTVSQESIRQTEQYQLENDSVFRFINQHDHKLEEVKNKMVKSFYREYQNYMENDDNTFPVNINVFEKRTMDWFKGKLIVEIVNNERIFKENIIV